MDMNDEILPQYILVVATPGHPTISHLLPGCNFSLRYSASMMTESTNLKQKYSKKSTKIDLSISRSREFSDFC
jgi:hypothetical protein